MNYDEELRLIEAALHRFKKRYAVPAAGAAMIKVGGDDIAVVVGERSRSLRESVQLSDKWHIGSCTKSLTAALWARLVERSYTDWDVSLADVFSTIGNIDKNWRNVTVRDALNCRAGLPSNFGKETFRAAWHDTRPLPEQRACVTEQALRNPPTALGRYLYSNLSYIIIGAAIDHVTDSSFEQALSSHILNPLGVNSVGYGPPDKILGHGSKLTIGNLGFLKGQHANTADARSDNPPVFSSAGSIHISLKDWASLLRIFLADAESAFLKEDSVSEIFYLPADSRPRMAMGWADAGLRFVSFVMQGSNTLWSATSALDRNRKRCVMIVCNDGRSRIMKGSMSLATYILALLDDSG